MSEVVVPAVGDTDAGFMNYLQDNLVQNVIRKRCSDKNATVKVREVQEVVPMGENYLSSLYRVFVEISSDGRLVKEKVLIVKMLPKNEFVQRFVRNTNVFQAELVMYNKLLPEMNRTVSDVLGQSPFSAASYDTGVDDMLAMEDLRLAGFKMADRRLGLDMNHCRLAVRALARFHGVSVAMTRADESLASVLPRGLFREETVEGADRLFRPRYSGLAGIVETWPGFQRFGDKLRAAGATIARKLVRVNDPGNTELAVLNHGDFWLNNMLFRYSAGGHVQDLRFVDFQLARHASPAVDLHYFLVTTPSDQVRRKGTAALLEAYHAELCSVLQALGCGDHPVTLDWLREELNDKMLFALHVACTILNIVVAEPDDNSQLSPVSNDSGVDESFATSYRGARYRQILELLLLEFEKEGVL